MANPSIRYLHGGDTALVIEFGNDVDRHVSALVIALAERIEAEAIHGIVELVPTFRSLIVHYDPLALPYAELHRRIGQFLVGLEAMQRTGRRWRLPACYDPALAPDLEEVAGRTGLTAAQVVDCHSATTFHVYMLGFLPGFPYMGDLPKELALPRRENPRVRVPPNSVAIATNLTTVYTLESPGGWHLLGRTPVLLWDMRRDPPALLRPGDQVMFQPISLSDYERLSARAAAGELRLYADAELPGARPARRAHA
jgi:KipI family sensor histidine kinase inhibitor